MSAETRAWPEGQVVHHLRLPLRTPVAGSNWRFVTLVGGPGGWGEFSPVPGYPADGAACAQAAEEAATSAWPEPRRQEVEVSAFLPAVAAGDVADFLAATGVWPAPHRPGCIKIKVGDAGDVDRVAAARDVLGPGVAIRVDANGAWDLDTAVSRLGTMARYGLELAEQPVAGLEDLAVLRRRVGVALAADEAVRTLDDARRLARLGAADAVVVKVQALGGFAAAARVVEAAGVAVVVSSLYETSVGLAVGLAFAASLPEQEYASGLGTAGVFEADVVEQPLVAVGGRMALRRVEPDPDRLARYSVRTP